MDFSQVRDRFASFPLIGVASDVQDRNGLSYHEACDMYIRALLSVGCFGVIMPSLGFSDEDFLSRFDGFLLTGAPSNVHPSRYDAPPSPDYEPYDTRRDGMTFPMIDRLMARDAPLLCICRGLQELNVALGGSLHTEIHRLEGRLNHYPHGKASPELKFAPVHSVSISEGGLLSDILGAASIEVNSVHRQAIDRLGSGLRVEACAEDGTIEAVSLPSCSFVLGIQWHPEYDGADSETYSHKIFSSFASSVREKMA